MFNKKIHIAVLAGALSLSMSMAAFSAINYTGTAVIDGVTKQINTNYFYTSTLPANTKDFITANVTRISSDNPRSDNYVYKRNEPTYPKWVIGDNGYYYYLTSSTQALKNTTTPDGYKVDSIGRWIDASGVPVTANIGNNVLNTKEKYAGKNDSEIMDLQIKYLRDLYQESCNKSSYNFASVYDESTSTVSSSTDLQYDNWMIRWNVENYIGNTNAFCLVSMSQFVETTVVNELVLRSLFGDELGIEIFNYVKNIENTNNNDDCVGCADRDFTNKFDLNKFKGRATDYGKTISDVTLGYYGTINFMLN